MRVIRRLMIGVGALMPTLVYAADATRSVTVVRNTGVSAVWMLANVSYAGMRAQGNPHRGWRIASFVFGFPGTLITFLAVKEGSERVYGFDLPKKR